MKSTGTREQAEALLRDLPSVVGVSVREDTRGHPREIHLLVEPGPDAAHLAYDVRDMLEDHLEVPIDQRVISIAQLDHDDADDRNVQARSGTPARRRADGSFPDRPVYTGLESMKRGARVEMWVRLAYEGSEYVGQAEEVDAGGGRIRAAATAALRAASKTCDETIRLELEAASTVDALGRKHVLVAAVAMSPLLGRRPLPLTASHPVDGNAELAAALAALKATNRVVARGLRAARDADPAPQPPSASDVNAT